jgi:2-polyprenyl-6-methoxyphenol hydroxylase-like FAD-dependent oxidoreductase
MKQTSKHVIVIGGSLAGLLAARVLSDYAERVTILERDPVVDEAEARKGQPQARHLHGLLARGLEIFNEFFPGFEQRLAADGATLGDMGLAMRWYAFGGYRQQYESGLRGALMSRPFLEWQIRRRVLALANVRLLSPCAVEGLVTSDDGRGITGVRLVHRQQENARETVAADLVVDASGRGSASRKWLAAAGYKPAPESEVKIGVNYASRVYRRRPGDLTGAELVMVTGTPPDDKCGGMVFPMEDNRWIVALAGLHGQQPPTDEEGFLAFAGSLPAPDVYKLISRAEPLSPIIPYRFPGSLRRHYEQLRRFPEGFLVMGDAVCSFNPIYGQGMTSAALQAEALRRLLMIRHGNMEQLWRPFFKEAAKVVDIPWQMAAGEDFRYADTVGRKAPGTDLINAYIARVHRATHHDTVVYGHFLRVMNLMAPPSSLFKPAVMRRVLLSRAVRVLSPQPQFAGGD